MSKARDNKKLVVGLDIGTSKIAAIVAEIKPEGGFEIIGMGHCPSKGLKKGVVVNIETTVQAIQRALEERAQDPVAGIGGYGTLRAAERADGDAELVAVP
ncbi:MAG: ftsA, partial [Betaproteobacteria bacterium]|nr:ftsA [Betaproteobacteria bacterium]